jgi:uncharacterized protein (TIGR00255 family)
MISSMTGFARRELSAAFGSLSCELRSVNHRFLDLGLRLPDACRALEPEFRQAMARELKRGKVDCTLQLRPLAAGAHGLDIDAVALERLIARVRELGVTLPQAAPISIIELLRWPGVLREETADGEQVLAAARVLFAETLAELAQARTREGERLAALINQRCTLLGAGVAAVRARLPEVHARIRARLEERLRELQAQVEPERIAQEIALMLARGDVAEELDRLEGHIEEARHALTGGEPAGRRLDFLMQEFNREANTLSSKSQDLETTRAAVEMKVVIEQMREQVQNIE